MGRHVVGIDPGLTEIGVVLCYDDDALTPIAWATFKSPTGHPDVARVSTLAATIVNTLLDWFDAYDVRSVDIVIELPLLGASPRGFSKQARLLQEIESGIFHVIAGEVRECWVTEINPRQSKALACNNANAKKPDVVAASPFKALKANKPTVEALADAWAHANAGWGVLSKAPRLNFAALIAAPVKHVYAGSKKDAREKDSSA